MLLSSLISVVARKLGDAEHAVWSYGELLQYLSDGYVDLTYRSPHIWDRFYVENLPYTANYNYDWELAYFTVGPIVEGRFDITYPWERNYFPGTDPAANHTYAWERTPPVVDVTALKNTLTNIPALGEKGYLDTEYIPATRVLPEDVQAIRRATFDGHRISATGPDELEAMDQSYESYQAPEQIAYSQAKDGLQVLRKYPVPSQRSAEWKFLTRWGSVRGVITMLDNVTRRMSIDEFHPGGPTGIIDATERSRFLLIGMLAIVDTGAVDPTGSTFGPLSLLLSGLNGLYIGGYGGPITGATAFAESTAIRGTLRVVPRHFAIGGSRGIVKRLIREQNNFRLEVNRRPQSVILYDPEIPRPFVLATQFYAIAQSFRKRGAGQNLKMATHYRERYEMYVDRLDKRGNAASAKRHLVVGGMAKQSTGSPAFPVYPDNFGYARFSLRRSRRFRR